MMAMRRVGEFAVYGLYAALWSILVPLLAVYFAVRARYRPLFGRLQGPPASIPKDAIWVHACSVGEVNAARPLLDAIARANPGAALFLTASTRTGHAHAAQSLPGVPLAWFPLDHPTLATRFVTRTRPRALVLIETELWPSVIRAVHRRGVPIVLANGRLSEKHFARYRRVRWLVAPMARALRHAAMQTETHAARMVALGLEGSRVSVCGNVKFDGAAPRLDSDAQARLDAIIQRDPSKPLLVLGSSRPGDEERIVAAWQAVRVSIPGVQLAIAPRHPGRLDEVERACAGFAVRRRSLCTRDDPWRGGDILLLDTIGELPALYTHATVVIVGGSFDPAIQGHNPIEPAALGKPVLFGPCMRNFDEAAELLAGAGAAILVNAAEELAAALTGLLTDAPRMEAMGTAGRAAVRAQEGAAERAALVLAEALKRP